MCGEEQPGKEKFKFFLARASLVSPKCTNSLPKMNQNVPIPCHGEENVLKNPVFRPEEFPPARPRPNFSRQKLPQEKKRWALPTRLSFSSLPEPGIKPRIFFKLFHLHCLRPFGSYARLQKLTLMETAFHQKEF